MGHRDRVHGKRVGVKDVTFAEFMTGENATKFITREGVVAYSQFQLREQIMPLVSRGILKSIRAYDDHQRASKWYRRFWRWLTQLGRSGPDLADPAVRAGLREQLDELEKAMAAGDKFELGALEKEQEAPDEPEHPTGVRTCVVCGTPKLEPVNENGGVKCINGHILEDPPAGNPEAITDFPKPRLEP